MRRIGARLALAAPVSLLWAGVAMTAVAVLPSSFAWLGAVLIGAGPLVGALTVLAGTPPRVQWLGMAVAFIVAAAVLTIVVFVALPELSVDGSALSPGGVRVLVYAPTVMVFVIGVALALVASNRSGSLPVWWMLALGLLLFGDDVSYAAARLAGADAVSGRLAFLGAPSVGMATFVGSALAGFAGALLAGPQDRFDSRRRGGVS